MRNSNDRKMRGFNFNRRIRKTFPQPSLFFMTNYIILYNNIILNNTVPQLKRHSIPADLGQISPESRPFSIISVADSSQMSVDFWNWGVEMPRFGAFLHQRSHRSFVSLRRLDDALVFSVQNLFAWVYVREVRNEETGKTFCYFVFFVLNNSILQLLFKQQ